MPVKDKIAIEETVDFLNDLLLADHFAISSLFSMRISCNEQLADHPTIQVGSIGKAYWVVGMIGILNGLFGTDENGIGRIIVDYTDGRIDRFRLAKDLVAIEKESLKDLAIQNPFTYEELKEAYIHCDCSKDKLLNIIQLAIKAGVSLELAASANEEEEEEYIEKSQ